MDKEAIKRLENNHYAANKAFQRLKDAIKSIDDQEIYAATGEVLLWVLTTDLWHKKYNMGYKRRKNNNKDGQLLFGLLHAYNCMKHNMDFIQIHSKEGGFEFPFEIPEEGFEFLPITVHWMKAGEVLEGDWPEQKTNYERYIEGKEILSTFEIALEFLTTEYKNIKQ
ncbi:hypothetical protein [Robertmurraya siralis]|uniref:hypothetical protein n=1 Tax=Robertmurraya siralis TaxID=77777 RepID=UPI0010F6D156|nr:hypothetical protein [Robertmurraya siralis]